MPSLLDFQFKVCDRTWLSSRGVHFRVKVHLPFRFDGFFSPLTSSASLGADGMKGNDTGYRKLRLHAMSYSRNHGRITTPMFYVLLFSPHDSL